MPRNLKSTILLSGFAGAFLLSAYVFGIYSERYSLWPLGRGYSEIFKNQNSDSAENQNGWDLSTVVTDREVSNTVLHNVEVVKILDGWHDGHLIILDQQESVYRLLFLSAQWMKNESIKLLEFDIETQSTKVLKIYEIPDSLRGTGLYKSEVTEKVFFTYVYEDERTCAGLSLNEINLTKLNSPLVTELYRSSCTLPPYGIHETGGKIAEDNSGALFLTVGDFEKGHLAADPNHPFGKILTNKTKSKGFEIYASGLRNSQGIIFDPETEQLIATDHGPEGGDEINFIEENKDYGWPHVTYGKPYGGNPEGKMFADVGAAKYGTHEGYELPEFAFVPSVGIMEIIKIPKESFVFPNWRGDFLTSTKFGIYRIRIRDNRVLFIEPLNLLPSVRSIAVHDSGLFFTASRPGIHLIRRKIGARN